MDDKAGFSTVIALVKDRMFATVWRILRHSQDAEDALQNALVTVWQRQAQVQSHPAPHALILRICTDAAIDQFRRRRMNHVDVVMFEDRLQSADSSPLDGLIRDERLDIVMAAISRLSPNQSAAIVMKYMLTESHDNIADALGCTTETVREHLSRGRERLGRALRNLGPDSLKSEVTTPFPLENER